ncbi:MAG: (Fe-S)-binding protein [Gemmatimonadales bacterium]
MTTALARPMRLLDGRSDLAACVHCGLCLPACPTYEATRDENDSPRGRLHLMRLAVEGRVATDGAFSHHIDRCLGCRACEPACPAGVRFGSLLERAREDRAAGRGDTGARWLIGAFTGRASPLAYAVLRALRGSGAAAAGARLPGRIGHALAWLAATAPRSTSIPPSGSMSSSSSAPPPAAPAGAPEGEISSATTYALLEGCVMRGLFQRVHDASRRVLRAAGYSERPAAGQGCCGALHAHAGLAAAARRLAMRNIEAFERSGARWFVVDAAGCGAAIKEYPDWLASSAEWSKRAEHVASSTRDVTRLVADSAGLDAELEAAVAHDAPCHLSFGLRDAEAPMQALSAMRGLNVKELPSSSRCCGGAGLYALIHPELSNRILEAKLQEIEEGGYDTVATGNPGCMMQIGAGLMRRRSRVGVAHPVEILDLGLRFNP